MSGPQQVTANQAKHKGCQLVPIITGGLGICLHLPSKKRCHDCIQRGFETLVISMTIVSQRLGHLNPWWPVGDTVCGGLELMALLEEMHHWGVG